MDPRKILQATFALQRTSTLWTTLQTAEISVKLLQTRLWGIVAYSMVSSREPAKLQLQTCP